MLQITAWLTALVMAFTTILAGASRARTVRPARARAVTLLEYVLLAAVVLGVIIALGVLFRDQVGNLVERISDFIGGA